MDDYGTIAGVRAMIAARRLTLEHVPDAQIAGWIAEGAEMLAHGIAAEHAHATVAHRAEAFARPVPPPLPPAPVAPPVASPAPGVQMEPVGDETFRRLLTALRG